MRNRTLARALAPLIALSLVIALLGATAAPEPTSANVAQQGAAVAPLTNIVPGEILVQRETGVSMSSLDLDVVEHLAAMDVDVVRVRAGDEFAEAARLSALTSVRYAEPNYLRHAMATPNDTYYANEQYNLTQIGMPAAWNITTGSSSIVVAVIDTGADLTHPDLAGKLTTGWDFANNDSDPTDGDGHGTHVSGIIGAATNNSTGIAGVGWNTRVLPIKALGDDGYGSDADIAEAIRWAADQGARIINLSLGGAGYSTTLRNAVDYAYSKNALLVAAMGNSYDQGNPIEYPAAYDHVVAVAAVTHTDQHTFYSNTGAHCDIAAPGGDDNDGIVSAVPAVASATMYETYYGTSQATPHVAGVAALMLAIDPGLTADEMAHYLKTTAVDLGTTGHDAFFGWGRLDAYAAVAAVSGQANPTSTPTSQPPTTTPTQTAPPATSTPTTQPATLTPTAQPATATPTATGPTPVLERRAVLPLVLGGWTDPLAPTPILTLTPLPSLTPTDERPTLTPTPTTETPAVVPEAGWWSNRTGAIWFQVAPDRQHIVYVGFSGLCASWTGWELDVPILADGRWTYYHGDEDYGGRVVGQFTHADRCELQTEDWNAWYTCGPEEWVALPED